MFNAKRHDRSTIVRVSFEFTWNVEDDIVESAEHNGPTDCNIHATALRTGEPQE